MHGNVCTKLPSYLNLAIPEQTSIRRRRMIHGQCPLGIHPIFQCSLNHINHDYDDPLLFTCNINPRTTVNDNTFFIRSYIEWNKLPLSIRIEESLDTFQDKLTNYIWELLREKSGLSTWPD